jgi:hypothetical protein
MMNPSEGNRRTSTTFEYVREPWSHWRGVLVLQEMAHLTRQGLPSERRCLHLKEREMDNGQRV